MRRCREHTYVFNLLTPLIAVYGGIGALIGIQVVTFSLFLKNIKPEYTNTFYSTMTGDELIVSRFVDNIEDEKKNYNAWGEQIQVEEN